MATQMSGDDTSPRSRRALLAGAMGGLGALAAGMIGRPKPVLGDNGDPVILGDTNFGSNTTIETNEENTALRLQSGDVGLNSFGGITGVLGRSVGETGVMGTSDVGVGVYGRSRTNYAGVFEGRVLVWSFIDLAERSTPARPPLNRARLFVRDNGDNHTQLCVKFPNGVVKVLATA